MLEPFSQGGDADAAADLALELQSGLLDALSNRSGVRVVTMEQGGVSPSYILKGRCRVSGNRCRLHLSITVAETGEINWTTKIDGTIDDMFDFVDDVVGQVGGVIRVHLNAVAGEAYASKPDNTLNVQQLLAKAAYYFHFFDRKSSDLSRETMAAAVEKAPEDPMVLAMQAYALMQTVPLAIERVEDVDVDEVMSFADRSAYHGPNVDFVFHQRARIRLWLNHDHEGCIKDANRSLAINPDYHLAKEDLALVDIFGGDIDRGLANLERIVEQFPTQPITPYRLSILGLGYAVTGDMATALTRALDGFERKPLVPLHALVYAVAASEKQDVTGSNEFRKMIEQHGLTVSDAHRFPFKRSQDTAKIVGLLRKAGLPE